MKKKIGFHLSIAGGVHMAIDKAEGLGINALQVFLKNSNRWTAPPFTGKDIITFKEKWRKFPELTISAHTGYLINPAGDGENLEKSKILLKDEISRAHALGIKYLVLHPGNHKEKGIDEGIKCIARTLDEIFSENDTSVEVLLETTAGQGSSVGHKFEHIRDILAESKYSQRLGVCLDTCHIFAAGYDISTEEGYSSTIDEFNRLIGIDKLKLFHLNDSKKGCGSKVDRHDHIGLGLIGSKGISFFLNDERFSGIDFIMETPDDEVRSDRDNLEAALSLLKV
jgi:deoxyribonuclease-4